MKTSQGEEVIDLASMTVNCILGQNDPWVSKNMAGYILSKQPSFHSSSFGSKAYFNYPCRLAKLQLANITDPVINHKQCNSSDIVDLAIRSAALHKGERNKIISFRGSYHGQNLTAFLVSDLQREYAFWQLAESDSIVFLEAPPHAEEISPGIALKSQEASLLSQIEALGNEAYACIIEPIQVNNLVNVCSWAFLKGLERVCKEKNICLIFDEIQTGFGWLGKLSAAELYDVKPNIALFSKALTAGYGPLAIMVAEQKYRNQTYGTSEKTNGADLRSLVAASAVLDRLIGLENKATKYWEQQTAVPLTKELKTGLLEQQFQKINDTLEHKLANLQSKYPRRVGKIKGYGLIRGIEILNDLGQPDLKKAQEFSEKCYKRGVFIRSSKGGVVIVKLPLVIRCEEIRRASKVLLNVLSEI